MSKKVCYRKWVKRSVNEEHLCGTAFNRDHPYGEVNTRDWTEVTCPYCLRKLKHFLYLRSLADISSGIRVDTPYGGFNGEERKTSFLINTRLLSDEDASVLFDFLQEKEIIPGPLDRKCLGAHLSRQRPGNYNRVNSAFFREGGIEVLTMEEIEERKKVARKRKTPASKEL